MLPYYWRNPLTPQYLEAKIHSLAEAEDDSWADLQGEGVAITPNIVLGTHMAMFKAVTIRSEVEDIPKEVVMGQEVETITHQLQPVFFVVKQATLQTVAPPTYLLRLQKTESIAFCKLIRAPMPRRKPRNLRTAWLYIPVPARRSTKFSKLLQGN